MIIYKQILQQLKDAGYSQARLRKENILSQCVIDGLRNGRGLNVSTLDKLCALLHCQPGDLIEYTDEKPEE